jgi:Fic family protein
MAHLEGRRWPGAGPLSGLSRQNRRGGSYQAYVPDRLAGRSFLLRGEDLADAADAERAVERLNQSPTPLADTEALARVLLRAESVASSRMEGLVVGARRLLTADLARASGEVPNDDTAAEVLANIDAMAFAIAAVGPGTQITPTLFLETHRRLLATTQLAEHAGHLRTEQNWIGRNDHTPVGAEYVPPPPEYVAELVDDLCAFCSDDALPAMVQAAIAHAQFETIHPFADGNGRVGRALIHMVLRRRGLVRTVIPPISLVLATRARDYVDGLSGTRYVGEPQSPAAIQGISRWVGIFAAACTRSVVDATAFEERIAAVQRNWRARLGSMRSGSAASMLVAMLPGTPVTTIAAISKRLARSTPATMEAVRRLVDGGILFPMRAGRQRGQVFEAREIIAAFTSLERQLASPASDTRTSPAVRPVPARSV